MANKKTSKKPKNYSASDLPIADCMPTVKTFKYDPSFDAAEINKLVDSLLQCVKEGDRASFNDVLSSLVNTMKKTELSKRAKLSRSTIDDAISKDGNVTIGTVFKIIGAVSASHKLV